MLFIYLFLLFVICYLLISKCLTIVIDNTRLDILWLVTYLPTYRWPLFSSLWIDRCPVLFVSDCYTCNDCPYIWRIFDKLLAVNVVLYLVHPPFWMLVAYFFCDYLNMQDRRVIQRTLLPSTLIAISEITGNTTFTWTELF